MRLIDADELLEFVEDRYEITWESDTYEGGIKDACSDIIEKIDNMPTIEQPQWIPVTERLPEYGAEVLTINTDGDYEINHIIDEEDAEWFFDGAVAWMPLPEAYKGGEEDEWTEDD